MSDEDDLSIPLAKSLVEVARGRLWEALDTVDRAVHAAGEDWRARYDAANAVVAQARIVLASAQDRYVLLLENELADARRRRAS